MFRSSWIIIRKIEANRVQTDQQKGNNHYLMARRRGTYREHKNVINVTHKLKKKKEHKTLTCGKGHAIAQAVSRWLPTTTARIQTPV
jgi:hypothetical protein